MQTREILELAALIAEHGPVLVRRAAWDDFESRPTAEENIGAYWSASRCRLNRWHARLNAEGGSRKTEDATPKTENCRRSSVLGLGLLSAVIEEILVSEVLTRVWTAVMCAYDRHRGTDLTGPVSQSVFAAHAEARHRVLMLLAGGCGLVAEEAMRLDELRRRAERWTDVLLGRLAGGMAASSRPCASDAREGVGIATGQFGFDPERVEDFAGDFRRDRGAIASSLWMSSMRAAFRRGLAAVSPSADLNAKIAAAIVPVFPPELLDDAGVPESLWLLRVSQTARVAEGWIDELLEGKRKKEKGKRKERD